MQKREKIANNYARAILQFLKDSKKALLVAKELFDFSSLIEKSPELKLVVQSRGISLEKKMAVITDLAKLASLSEEAKRMLSVIIKMKRLSELGFIAENLRIHALKEQDIEPVTIISSIPLSETQSTEIQTKVKTLLGKAIDARVLTQSKLLGGIKVLAAGKTLDFSILGWLVAAEEQYVGGEI